jgi:hypothetical protein
MLMRRPRNGFDGCQVTPEFSCGFELVVHRPHIELVVVASRGELLLIVGPFQTADLLLVTL